MREGNSSKNCRRARDNVTVAFSRINSTARQTISRCFKLIGSFSNYNGDGSENVEKAIGLISKTTTLHVQDTFLYISLPSLHDYGVKIPNLTFCGGRKQAITNFSFYFKI